MITQHSTTHSFVVPLLCLKFKISFMSRAEQGELKVTPEPQDFCFIDIPQLFNSALRDSKRAKTPPSAKTQEAQFIE